MTKKHCTAALLFSTALAALGTSAALAEGLFKNLQVLPKDISKPELKAVMKKQARALGVECDHCHTQPNMDAETKNKKIGREMMILTNAINQGTADKKPAGSKDLIKAWDYYKKHLDGKKDVTCETCHQGHEEPPKDAK